jgi:hypothetical protein
MSRDFTRHRTPLDVLDYEIVQERAAALGRMGRALEASLAKLREFDAANPRAGAPAAAQQARRTLVIEGRPRALDVRGAARGVWPAGQPHRHEQL